MKSLNDFLKVHTEEEIDQICNKDIAKFWHIMNDFANGFKLLADVEPGVTIFGSARVEPGSRYYEETRKLGALLARAGVTVITGGGPGVMEAGNRGAFEAGGEAVGLNINLPHEQHANNFTTKSYKFKYFFVRKVMFVRFARAFVIFPGGYGTMDELFEILMLIQTNKIHNTPIILADREYWNDMLVWMKKSLLGKEFISPEDLDFIQTMDTPEEISAYLIDWMKTHKENGERIKDLTI